ncbi:MAG: sugar phosphate isomerase/epimerase [Planctomycetaceae bacterium]|nr:sugar phosphate isomerase/epimerase [Planctomycetales bacterium]MCB9925688.1 sugar phosphate isomerase/epimerase [Planctomycetaceae bacterium]
MKLSLSVRIAESACKTKLNIDLSELLRLAVENGYEAICMRASAAGIQTPPDDLRKIRDQVEQAGLVVSMVTADCDVPLNNDNGPNSLRNIGPSLDVATALGCDLIRVCLKQPADVPFARMAAEQAAERNIRLAHQCHTTTLFEQIDRSLEVLHDIDRPNFGLIYEPANLMLCGEPYDLTGLQRLQPFLMNAYVQNHRLDADGPEELETWCRGPARFHHLPLWEPGGVDFVAAIEGLKAVGYDGYLTVHQHYAHIMGPDEAAIKSARYLRGLIA